MVSRGAVKDSSEAKMGVSSCSRPLGPSALKSAVTDIRSIPNSSAFVIFSVSIPSLWHQGCLNGKLSHLSAVTRKNPRGGFRFFVFFPPRPGSCYCACLFDVYCALTSRFCLPGEQVEMLKNLMSHTSLGPDGPSCHSPLCKPETRNPRSVALFLHSPVL